MNEDTTPAVEPTLEPKIKPAIELNNGHATPESTTDTNRRDFLRRAGATLGGASIMSVILDPLRTAVRNRL